MPKPQGGDALANSPAIGCAAAETGVTAGGHSVLEHIGRMPADAWPKCSSCGAIHPRARLVARSGVCPDCGGYSRLTARERTGSLVDQGTFVEHHTEMAAGDPLGFTDRRPYPDRLRVARNETGLTDAVVIGTAQLGRYPVSLAVMDFGFLGGSMGIVVGEKVTLAAEHALANGIPLVVVCASGGARMQEGVFSLLQMAKTAAAIRLLRDASVPVVCVLTDPVYGGVAASFASLGDVILAEAGARAGFAGPRVIEQTLRKPLPPELQTAGFLLDHGHVDLVVSRTELAPTLARLVAFAMRACHRVPRAASATGGGNPARQSAEARAAESAPGAWEAMALARHPGRPVFADYAGTGFDGFLELHGDRWREDDPAISGGLAYLAGRPVMIVGHAKGRDTAENVRRNFGMPHPSGYRKAIRLYRLAERLGVPVVTLIDTPGAYPGTRAEEENQSAAIAEALATLAGLSVPVVAVVTGEGGSGGALALALADRLLMQENATLSVISPEGCASILFGDVARAPGMAHVMQIRAIDLLRHGVADRLIAEPDGGAHRDPAATVQAVIEAVRRELDDLADTPAGELVGRRHRRYRAVGTAFTSEHWDTGLRWEAEHV